MGARVKTFARRALFVFFIFAATFPLLNMIPMQYLFFIVFYLLMYVLSERTGGRMTPLLRLMEAGLSLYLFSMNTLSFLSGVYFTPELFYGTLALVLAWLFFMALKKAPVPRFFFLSVLFPFLCFAYIPENVLQDRMLWDCPRIEENSRVQALFSLCDWRWKETLKPYFTKKNYASFVRHSGFTRTVFVTDNPKVAYLAFGRPNYRKHKEPQHALIKVDRVTKKIISALPASTIIHMAHDKKRGLIYATALDENAVYAVDETTFTLRREIPVALHPIYVFVDGASDALLVVCDFGVYVYDLKTFKEKRHFVPHMAPSFASVDRGFTKIFMCGYSTTFLVRSISLNDGSMERNRAGWIPPFSLFCSVCSLDDEEGVLFAAMPMQRRIVAYRAEDLQFLYHFPVSGGIRDMDYDPVRKKLYAGNYITGNVEVIDPFARKTEKKIFVGKRIRDIFYSHATKKVYAATSLGFFEVTP